MITTYERGKAEGKLEGIQEGKLEGRIETYRENVLLMLDTRFSPLSPSIHQRVAEMTLEQLRQLLMDLIQMPMRSLKELHLEE
jgi:predicted transposase YdaD